MTHTTLRAYNLPKDFINESVCGQIELQHSELRMFLDCGNMEDSVEERFGALSRVTESQNN